jgi:hypothetical protein
MKQPSRIDLAAFLMILVGRMGAQQALAAKGMPNFLLVVADDLGWTDIGSYGGSIGSLRREPCGYQI